MNSEEVQPSAGRPDWRDEGLGTRIRVALWLMEKGEGAVFEKQELRSAMPGVEQIDRRMRDLRPAGWVIHTYRDRADLKPDQLRLSVIGTHVWEPEKRGTGLRSISAKVRREVYERDGHKCIRCGVTPGEEYDDAPGTFARLTLGHVRPHKSGSAARVEDLVTECDRCNENVKHLTGVQLDTDQVWDRITELPKRQKAELLKWMIADRRTPASDSERRWAEYRQLPGAARDDLQRRLAGYFADEAVAEAAAD